MMSLKCSCLGSSVLARKHGLAPARLISSTSRLRVPRVLAFKHQADGHHTDNPLEKPSFQKAVDFNLKPKWPTNFKKRLEAVTIERVHEADAVPAVRAPDRVAVEQQCQSTASVPSSSRPDYLQLKTILDLGITAGF